MQEGQTCKRKAREGTKEDAAKEPRKAGVEGEHT